MKPSVQRPWVTWADGFLCLTLIALLLSAAWLSYRDGRYCEGWIWIVMLTWPPTVIMLTLALILRPWLNNTSATGRAGLILIPFGLGLLALTAPYVGWTLILVLLALVLRTWLKRPDTAQWAQLWIRPILLAMIALAAVSIYKLQLVNLPGATPFVTGCMDSVRDCVTEKDIQILRDLVAQKRSDGKLEEGPNAIPLNELPPSIRKSSWGDPRPGEISLHQQDAGCEIEIFWGGALPGYFGIRIDPEKPPRERREDNDEESFSWHYKLADGVYFFHYGG
ncbi:MAG: hypothetical protein V4662_04215 [Verrucomicrobiota bacterium]